MTVPVLPQHLEPAPSDLTERVVTREQVLHGHFLRVLRDTVTATGWVYETIKRICGAHG